jgi:cobalt-zinc-cadmium efflux system protein
MSHHHHHYHSIENEKALLWAVVVNIALTIIQIIGGVLSGSLALLADAIHNFSDAGSLIIAYYAQKLSGKPATKEMTFGYGRAQILGALINSVSLMILGIYLIYEAWKRFADPQPVDGLIVIGVAMVAVVIDLATAWLTHKGAKDNINMRAAYIHNISDALASVAVIIAGIFILLYDVYWVDLVATVFISFYIMYMSVGLIKSSVKILMQAVPDDLNKVEITNAIKAIDGIEQINDLHVWAVHDKLRSLEAVIKVSTTNVKEVQLIRQEIRKLISEKFNITHSTIEIDW